MQNVTQLLELHLLLSYALILIALLCLSCKIGRSFVSLFLHVPLADFIFIVSQLHGCVVCIALPADLVVVPTQGSYFVFVVFLCCFLKKSMLWLGGGSKG